MVLDLIKNVRYEFTFERPTIIYNPSRIRYKRLEVSYPDGDSAAFKIDGRTMSRVDAGKVEIYQTFRSKLTVPTYELN